jgi:hypothetical protein
MHFNFHNSLVLLVRLILLKDVFKFSVCKVVFARSQYIQLDTCSQMYWWIQTYAEFVLAMSCFLLDMATFYKLVRINQVRINQNDQVEAQKRLLERLFLIQVWFVEYFIFIETKHCLELRRLGHFFHHVHSEHDLCGRLSVWSLALYRWRR